MRVLAKRIYFITQTGNEKDLFYTKMKRFSYTYYF